MKTILSKSQLPDLVLGSSSFRKKTLEKLQLPFLQCAPEIDETPLKFEQPKQMIERLSLLKAQMVAQMHPNSIVIASDQCATFKNKPIGKPFTHAKAVEQLHTFSGQSIVFYTGLAVIDPRNHTTHFALDTTCVHFRTLTTPMIESYLNAETPYQCAGSFKSEGLGITLFKQIDSKDPNGLIGLPLIELTNIFKKMQIMLPLSD